MDLLTGQLTDHLSLHDVLYFGRVLKKEGILERRMAIKTHSLGAAAPDVLPLRPFYSAWKRQNTICLRVCR